MTARILNFPTSKIVRISPDNPAALNHARTIERWMAEMEEARFKNAVSVMHPDYADSIPSDVEVK